MPAITVLTFTKPLNVSCQVGDTAYYVVTTGLGGFNINSAAVIEIGIITDITGLVVTVGNSMVSVVPVGAFILFSKDNKANMNSVLGYYAEVKLRNTNNIRGNHNEIFSVAVDMFESSK